jgi:O-antigen ligase
MSTALSLSTKIEKAFFWSLFSLFLTPILPQLLKILAIAFFVLICLASFIESKSKFKWKFFLINAGVYIAYLFSVTYSSDLNYAVSKLEVSLSILLFPLGFSLVSSDLISSTLSNLKLFLYTYIVAILLLNIYLVTLFIYEGNSWNSFIDYSDFLNNVKYIPQMHSLYLGMHNSVAILMVLYLLKTERFLKRGAILFLLGFLLGIGLILLLKKGSTFALLFVSTLLCLKYKLRRVWAFYFVFIFSLATFFIVFPELIKNFNQLFKVEKVESSKSSTDIQEVVLNCSNQRIKDAGLFGFGVGDAKNELVDCYGDSNQDLASRSYNTHNQYLSLILMIGWLGLLLFLIILLYNLNHAFRSKMYISVGILLIYIVIMLSENILERQEGVVYFSLFMNFFLFINYKEQRSKNSPNTFKFDKESLTH